MQCKNCGEEIQGVRNDETGRVEYKEYVLGDGSTRCEKCKEK